MRLVSVRYIVPVYATVDLDAEPRAVNGSYPDDAITRVFQADESIRIDNEAVFGTDRGNVLDDAIEADPEYQVDPRTLSEADQAKAVRIAERTDWPVWERG